MKNEDKEVIVTVGKVAGGYLGVIGGAFTLSLAGAAMPLVAVGAIVGGFCGYKSPSTSLQSLIGIIPTL